jgi:glutathione S-transferase
MELYFSPLACSLATRVALYEAKLEGETTFHNVTLSTRRTEDGRDYWKINAKGQVPALITREGELLTEGPAVLQYVADLAPETGLAPSAGTFERYRVQQWLNFISTELHKQVFAIAFNPGAPAQAKEYALNTVLPQKLEFLDRHLSENRPYLAGATFTVADAYLLTVLNWPRSAGVDLARFPSIRAYHERMLARPQVARALAEELKLAGLRVASGKSV